MRARRESTTPSARQASSHRRPSGRRRSAGCGAGQAARALRIDTSAGGTLAYRADHETSPSRTPRAAATALRRARGRSGVRVPCSPPWRPVPDIGVSAYRVSGRPVGRSSLHPPWHGRTTSGCLEGYGDPGRVPSTCNPADVRRRTPQGPGRGSPRHRIGRAADTSRTMARAGAKTLTSGNVPDVPNRPMEVKRRRATGERSACGVAPLASALWGQFAGEVPNGSRWRATESPCERGCLARLDTAPHRLPSRQIAR